MEGEPAAEPRGPGRVVGARAVKGVRGTAPGGVCRFAAHTVQFDSAWTIPVRVTVLLQLVSVTSTQPSEKWEQMDSWWCPWCSLCEELALIQFCQVIVKRLWIDPVLSEKVA